MSFNYIYLWVSFRAHKFCVRTRLLRGFYLTLGQIKHPAYLSNDGDIKDYRVSSDPYV
jgi:hypothetical protein